jgi:hypothetical protein
MPVFPSVLLVILERQRIDCFVSQRIGRFVGSHLARVLWIETPNFGLSVFDPKPERFGTNRLDWAKVDIALLRLQFV